jgi:transcriptional antiterminator RfaH
MRRWYVAHTQPGAEAKAAGHLERQGFATWLPLCARTVRHARRARLALRPLFPRYLFVALDREGGPWRAALSTQGVAGLVGGRAGPAAVPDAVIAALRARAGADGLFAVAATLGLKPGDRVRIAAGALAGVEAILGAATPDARVAVLLGLLGREVSLKVPAGDLEPA